MDPITAIGVIQALIAAYPPVADVITRLMHGQESTAQDHAILNKAMEAADANFDDAVARYRQRHATAGASPTPADLVERRHGVQLPDKPPPAPSDVPQAPPPNLG